MIFQWEMLPVLLGSTFGMAVFYALYEKLLRRETFFQANRIYLLITPLIAVLVPCIRIALKSPEIETGGGEIIQLLIIQSGKVRTEIGSSALWDIPALQLSWGELILRLYVAGAIFYLARVVWAYTRLAWLINRARKVRAGDYVLVEQDEIGEAASFFHFVFWNKRHPMPEFVLNHELVHIRQHHTFDLLLMECWTAMHWFNPFMYRFRSRLRETHEFIADAEVVASQGSAYHYARLLIAQPDKNLTVMPYNTFAAQITQRLRMLAKGPSAPWRIVQYSICLPVLAGMFLLFSVDVIRALPMLPVDNWQARLDRFESSAVFPSAEETTAATENSRLVSISTEVAETNTRFTLDPLPGKYTSLASILDTVPKTVTIKIETSDKKEDAGSGKSVTITGMDKKPIFILDGKLLEGGEETLNTIDPNDIHSVNVLKGESAIKIYGEKGADGVVVITTKKAAGNKEGTTMVIGGNAEKQRKEVKVITDTIVVVDYPDGPNPKEVTVTVKSDDSKKSRDGEKRVIKITQKTGDGEAETVKPGYIVVMADGKVIHETAVKSNAEPMFFGQVHSLEVLKGDEAVKKYGEKARNGVMIFHFSDLEKAKEMKKMLQKQER